MENYQAIANDHVAHWRLTGNNPFQTDHALRQNEAATVGLVVKYADGGRLLDAGCGMGDLMLALEGYEVDGVEIADAYIEVARERGLLVEKGYLESLKCVDEWFDVVTCTDVLEHVLDVNAVVFELHRVLKPGGVLVARVPDAEPVAWHDQGYEFIHLRIFDEGTLRLLFGLIFDMEVLECLHVGNSLHIAARKK